MFGKPGLLGFGRKKKEKEEALKDKVSIAIYLLDSTIEKLKTLTVGLTQRDERYFEQCIEATISQDSRRAIMYANECAEIRRFVSLVMGSQLALEKARLRLGTVGTLSEILSNISPMMELVSETGRRLKGIVPSVTGQLEQVDSVLKASLSDMGSATSSDPRQATQEVQSILEEANKAAEDAVRSKFPEFPPELVAEFENPKIPVALADGVGDVADEERPVKELVYDYIKERKGKLSIAECASDLGVTPREVEQTILQLKDEGKVTL